MKELAGFLVFAGAVIIGLGFYRMLKERKHKTLAESKLKELQPDEIRKRFRLKMLGYFLGLIFILAWGIFSLVVSK